MFCIAFASGRESVSILTNREVRGHYFLGGAGQGERNMDWWRTNGKSWDLGNLRAKAAALRKGQQPPMESEQGQDHTKANTVLDNAGAGSGHSLGMCCVNGSFP